MVAPNGARRTKTDHPRLPITAAELGAEASACRAAGATAIHVHVRDGNHQHSLDPALYRGAITSIRTACPEIIIQVTTEAAGLFNLDQQIASVKSLCPLYLSYSISELTAQGEARAEQFLAWAAEVGIAIQFILYNDADIGLLARLHRSKRLHLPDAPRVLLVAGRYSVTQDSNLAEFNALYGSLCANGLHEESIWMTCAFGRGEMACLERTIELGGHARVGFENAIVDSSGRLARDNAERVSIVADLAARHDRKLANPDEAAKILGRRDMNAVAQLGRFNELGNGV
jgi:3-keto-5-aminohexanoate cleavage enzyme